MVPSRGPLLLAALALAAGCASRGAVEMELTPIEGIVERSQSGIEDERRTVIETTEAWLAFWREVTTLEAPPPPAPEIDFEKRIVVYASMGTQPSGGYRIAIPTVYEDRERIFVEVVRYAPGVGCVTTQALSAPVAAVAVEKRDKPVAFIDRLETVDCESDLR